MKWTKAFLIIFITISCSRKIEFPEWLNEWLNHQNCNHQCWKDIHPGLTTMDEALEILSSNSEYAISWYPSLERNSLVMMWDFKQSKESGYILADQNSEIIKQIRLNLLVDTLRVADIVHAFGYPSHIMFSGCIGEFTSHFCELDLIYMEKGMVLELLLDNNDFSRPRVKITPNSIVGFINLIPPGFDGYAAMIGKDVSTLETALIEWDGYGSYIEK